MSETKQVRRLRQAERFEYKKQLKQLLADFSDEVATRLIAGELDELFWETLYSPSNEIGVTFAGEEAVGMYVGTIKPAFLKRVLYIAALIVSFACRKEGIGKQLLIPDMKKLAQEKIVQ